MLFGQFTYATIAAPGPYSDASGWKVKQVVPDPDRLRPWVERAAEPLGTFSPATVPLLATEAEIDALPRRLRLDVLSDSVVALLNQSSAGRSNDHRDSSFTHGLLVRPEQGRGIDELRPAELWPSAGWLRPVGADRVRDAVLADEPELSAGVPAPGPVESDWAQHKNLALLLLSVLEGGSPAKPGAVSRIALIDPTGAVTARWVAFLGRHLTAGASWTAVPFSTHETALEGRAASMAALRVIGIPADEEAGARRALGGDWVVLDPAAPLAAPAESAGRQGVGWELPGGRWVPVGAWAQLAERLTVLDEMGLGTIGELLDRIAAESAGTADARPMWALPAALLVASGPVRDLMSQVLPEAVELVRVHFPPGLRLPESTKDALLHSVSEHAAQPMEAFAGMLRAVDTADAAGYSDTAVEGYLGKLWGPGPDGGPPAWVTDTGPLPWLPQASSPSPDLAETLLAGLPGRLAWAGILPDDPERTVRIPVTATGTGGPDVAPALPVTARVRILACVHELFARWGLDGRPPVSTIIAPQLVSATLESMRAGSPVAAGGWPVLRPAVFDQVRAGLEADLQQRSALPDAVLRWLDQQCGPLQTADRAVVERMSLLNLERARHAVLSAGAELPAAAVTLRAATVLRDALVPGPAWPVDTWVGALRYVFAAEPALDDARWLLSAALARRIPVPAAAIGDQLVRRYPLDPQAAGFAEWLLGPAAATGRVDERFPALASQQACRSELPATGELAGDVRWTRELAALGGMAMQSPCQLRDSVLPRLAADVLLMAAPLAVAGRWPWPGDGPIGALTGVWTDGFELLDQATAGTSARLALARSLFVRALVADQVAVQQIRLLRPDPAGRFLTERPHPDKDEWRVETLLHRLVDGVDRADKQQWITDVHADATRTCAAVPGAPPRLATAVSEMVEQNAATMVFGNFGARLPFNRARAARPAEPTAGDNWGSWG